MSENLAVRPGQLRTAPQRTEKPQALATQLEKSTPSLATNGRVVAPERALASSTKLDSRAHVVKDQTTAPDTGSASEYGATPDVTGKGRSVDIRVY